MEVIICLYFIIKFLNILLLFSGKCVVGPKQPSCKCPTQFAGRRCDIDLCVKGSGASDCLVRCAHNPCENDGVCVIHNGIEKCRCTHMWGGDNCQVYMGHDNPCLDYCKNGALCTIASPSASPECYCLGSWIGKHCNESDACLYLVCKNGGTCVLQNQKATCV